MTSPPSASAGAAGSRRWYFPDGDLPPASPTDPNGGEHQPTAHESLMILNVGDRDAHVRISFFFEDHASLDGITVTVPSRRVRGLRTPWTGDDGQSVAVPVRTQYAMAVESDEPVVCQYGRAETTPSYVLYTTMGWHE